MMDGAAMKKNKRNRIITIALPMMGILILLMKEHILALIPYIPSCFLYSRLHLYCPACGNTRSVTALLHGDLIASLQYNITPLLVLFLAVAAYLEFAFTSFGKPIKLLPRRLWFYLVLITLMIVYYLARNLSPALAP
jgi:hypothetical protein